MLRYGAAAQTNHWPRPPYPQQADHLARRTDFFQAFSMRFASSSEATSAQARCARVDRKHWDRREAVPPGVPLQRGGRRCSVVPLWPRPLWPVGCLPPALPAHPDLARGSSSFELGKRLAEVLADRLPSSKAQVSRAPHNERIASLISSHQMDVALMRRDDAAALRKGGLHSPSTDPLSYSLSSASESSCWPAATTLQHGMPG